MNAIAEMLTVGKNRILNVRNWCPAGWGNGSTTFCAIAALTAGSTRCFRGEDEARNYLSRAAYTLYNNYNVPWINDSYEVGTENERFKMVHNIYDKAIEMAEAEAGNG